ncbi:MAG: methyltransferase domain-containing protein [Candidatus Omnitrophica bacterium]|nr:methyltransferase domain-containing protein [Candidatus Omnitrophota bacterium]
MKRLILKFFTRLIRQIRIFWLFKIGVFIRIFKKRPYPVNKDGKVLIHVGCGELDDRRFINVDSRVAGHVHVVGTIEDFPCLFPEGYADLIYACHVLEHVSHLKLIETLLGLRRCLKKGGILRVSVPDFKTLVYIYENNKSLDYIIPPLMGGQGYAFNFHHSVFDESYLSRLFLEAGFSQVRLWDPQKVEYHEFDDWSRRKINLSGQEFSISLNLEAVK